MKNLALLTVILVIVSGCGQKTTVGTGSSVLSGAPLINANGTVPTITGNNVLTVNVGTTCGGTAYVNEPCTSVKICPAGSTMGCQTLNNILVDTGSFGLRIFSSALTVSLTQVSLGGTTGLAECALFGTGSTWGPVDMANVTLGNESPVTIPIQVVNSSYATVPAACGTPDTQASSGFNGILGVGLWAQDCGSDCTTDTSNGMYYGCTGSSCVGSVATLAQQVVNPIYNESTDNNGAMMIMPTVAFGGNAGTSGYLVLGVGTASNNVPSGTQTFTADTNREMTVTLNGKNLPGFVDSGSNGFFIPSYTYYPSCPSSGAYGSWFCPTSNYTTVGTTIGKNGTSYAFQYQIANAITQFNTGNYALMNLGGALSGIADLGLPFFFGRTIYVGILGTSSSVGSGAYWAY